MGNSRNEPRAAAETQMSPLLSSICFVPGDRQKFPQRNLLFSRREKAPNGEWRERGRGHFVEQTCDGGENCRALGNGEREREIEHSSREVVSVGPRIHTAHEAASKSCIVIRSCNHASDTLSHALLATSAHFGHSTIPLSQAQRLGWYVGQKYSNCGALSQIFSSCHVNWDLIRESAE